MPIRLSPAFLLPAVFGAAVVGLLATSSMSAPAAPAPAVQAPATTSPADTSTSMTLPPNHPAIPAGMAGHGFAGGAVPNGESEEPAAITWVAPSAWQSQPNPNPMRLATYKVGAGAEVSVARAGGSVDANVQRWAAQFDGSPKVDRSEKQVHGLKVTVVRIAGTFLGSGMSGSAPEKRDGWAMRAAIVESTGAPYFFKLLGPADQVDAARASFDELLGSVARAAQ